MRVAKRMIDRNGKAKESIVKGWSMDGRWIREVKENLRRYGIGEDKFEELEWKELNRKMTLVEEDRRCQHAQLRNGWKLEDQTAGRQI